MVGGPARGSLALKVVEDAAIFRTKEQVLVDLSKALRFSPESLAENRAGRLSREQVKQFAGRCLQPGLVILVCAVAPFLVWTSITAGAEQLPFSDALLALLHKLMHVNELFETRGRVGGLMMLGSIFIPLAVAVVVAFRFPFLLYLDLLDGKVEVQEGRVVAREEQINRANGRDPIENYFFSLRHLTMKVNLAAYRAIENGSIYLVYLLPRSETLVALEPKMEDTADPPRTSPAPAPAENPSPA